jgi:LysR family transcriptional regulator for metE and metH
MNIALHHFKLVNTIVKEGTLTKAASSLFLTQSALSHQLKELEKELATEIFHRKGKRLELSDEGFRFLSSAEKILTELKALEEDINNFKKGKTGKLNISTQCYTTYHWLPCIIKHFKDKSPDINIHIVSEATQRPLDYLLNGDLDIGIVKTRIPNPNIHYEPIYEDQLMVIMSKNHPLAKKRVIKISDFQDEELYLSFNDPSSGNVPIIESLLQLHNIKPKNLHRIHYTDAIIEMVDADLGICVLADWIIQPFLDKKNIVAKPLPGDVARRTWYAATCKQNAVIKNFLDCLKQHFTEINLAMNNADEHATTPSFMHQLLLNAS